MFLSTSLYKCILANKPYINTPIITRLYVPSQHPLINSLSLSPPPFLLLLYTSPSVIPTPPSVIFFPILYPHQK